MTESVDVSLKSTPITELSKEQKILAFAKKHANNYVEGEGELITKIDWFAVSLALANIASGFMLSLMSIIFLITADSWGTGLLNGAFLLIHILQIIAGISIIVFSVAMEAIRRIIKSSPKITDLATKNVPPLALKIAFWGASRFLDARIGLMFLGHWIVTIAALLAVGYRIFW